MRQVTFSASVALLSALLLTQHEASARNIYQPQPQYAIPTLIPAYRAKLVRRDHKDQPDKPNLQKRACNGLDQDCGNGFCCRLTTTCVLPDQGTGADTKCQFGGGGFPFNSLQPAYAADVPTQTSSVISTATDSAATTSTTTLTLTASPTSTAATPTPTLDSPMNNNPSLHAGTIAGFIIAIIVVVALVIALIVTCVYKRKRRGHAELSSVNGDTDGQSRELIDLQARSRPGTGAGAGAGAEAGSGAGPSTASVSSPHEKPLPPTLATAPNFGPVQEMEAAPPRAEMDSSSPRAEVMGDMPGIRKKKPFARWSRPVHEMQG